MYRKTEAGKQSQKNQIALSQIRRNMRAQTSASTEGTEYDFRRDFLKLK